MRGFIMVGKRHRHLVALLPLTVKRIENEAKTAVAQVTGLGTVVRPRFTTQVGTRGILMIAGSDGRLVLVRGSRRPRGSVLLMDLRMTDCHSLAYEEQSLANI
ncbi:hypothetical protein Tco_0956207 [Tanacetum coccineum]|uniref:Uncharacterized protein n=1 Tax=Tanacetum coccineum TaxID=301880 RepID=A0ABQ5E9E0_9ASTR